MVTKLKKAELEFEEMIKELGDTTPIPYSTDSSFEVGDFLEHKVFGIGKVVDLITPDKMTVHFLDGNKILMCVFIPSA